MADDSSVSDSTYRSERLLERALIYSGFAFCIASAAAMTYGIYLIFTTGSARRAFAEKGGTLTDLIGLNIDIVTIVIFCIVAAIVGLSFFKYAGRSTNYVIRPEDRERLWPLIEKSNVQSVDQYIRLASLSGFSGAFTKVGFTGLPLATVALTLIFVLLSLFYGKADLMELAKLTLGAFIGSFVQRQVEQGERQVPGSGSSSSSETTTMSATRPRLPV
jgi:hypothetical protein